MNPHHNLNLNQVRSFLLVAEESNLTRAAERRHSTPSAVTAHIRQLEERLGVDLFDRTHSGMTLTDAGERLLPAARRMMAAARELSDTAATLHDNPTRVVSVGLNAPPEHLRVSELLGAAARGVPALMIQLETSMTERVLADTLSGRLDGGFAYGPVDDPALARESLGQRRLRVAVPGDCSLDRLPADPAARAALPWIWPGVSGGCPFRRLMPDVLGASTADVNIVTRVDGEESIRAMVRAGIGFGLLEERYGQEAADDGSLRLLEPWWPIELGFVYRAERSNDADIQALLGALRTAWSQRETCAA